MMTHLVEAVDSLCKALERRDVPRLKALSKELIRSSALRNDRLYSKLSMIAYSLNKLILRRRVLKHKTWPQAEEIMVQALKKALVSAKKGDAKELERNLGSVNAKLNAVDGELGRYVQNLEEKARVKMASNAYALGLSIQSAAELTGADIKQVQTYVGWTRMHDEEGVTLSISQRLRKLREAI